MAYRRSIFLIDKRFQLRFAFFVCSWLFGLSLVYPLLVYNLFEFFSRYLAVIPGAPTTARLEDTRYKIILLLVVLQALFLGITFLISIFVSHRIAGPLYKLKRFMTDAGAGQINAFLRFRDSDHFKDVAETYNEMTTGIRGILRKNFETAEMAVARLEKLRPQLPSPARAELDELIAALREVIERAPIAPEPQAGPAPAETSPET
jgi:sensor histidine kinase YesM